MLLAHSVKQPTIIQQSVYYTLMVLNIQMHSIEKGRVNTVQIDIFVVILFHEITKMLAP